MQKLLLISFIIAPVMLPMIAAGDPSPVRGLRRAIAWWLAFNVCYLLAFLFVYPRIF